MERTDNGILIAFDGIDGAGKTTQVDLLERFLKSAGEPVIRSKEPTDGPWGRKIRESAATGRMTLEDELHAFTEDRKQHVRDLILPALRAGQTVILDRYFYSTIAYQGTRGGDIEALTARMLESAPEPDVVFLIDVPPAVGVSRIMEGRGESPNAFEEIKSLAAVRDAFRQLAATDRKITVIDGTLPIDHAHRVVLSTLLDGILKARHCAKAYGCDQPEHCAYRITGTCRWAAMRRSAGILS